MRHAAITRPYSVVLFGRTRTLKEHLLAHLRARPGKLDPETQRMAKGFHSSKVGSHQAVLGSIVEDSCVR